MEKSSAKEYPVSSESPVIHSASPRDNSSSPPPLLSDALEDEHDKWPPVVPLPDLPYRLRASPRKIELFDWIVPFHMFTVLIDLRDRLRYAYSFPPEPEPDLFPGKPRQETMSQARAEATVTKVMGPSPKPQTISVKDPYNISPRTLTEYIASTTGNRIRIPYQVCRIVLSTEDRPLLINGRKILRSVFEAILQCRHHEWEGAFVGGIVFDADAIKRAVEKEKSMTSPCVTPAGGTSATAASYSHSASSSISTLDLAAVTTTTSMSPSISTTPMMCTAPSSKSPLTKAVSTPEIPSPEPKNLSSAFGKKEKEKQKEAEKEEQDLNFQPDLPPFLGYEPRQLAGHVGWYLSEQFKHLIYVDEALVRILFGMPERGRTFKVGGASGWGKYGKDVTI
ncbi:hypothetical protein VTN00DRAFT_7200 [Thermoascus crustaceus]|uniref:uncharacterized protein n=1 Tax=Thermoascus crustaceus TaxID=5088 RepID=UPI003742E520